MNQVDKPLEIGDHVISLITGTTMGLVQGKTYTVTATQHYLRKPRDCVQIDNIGTWLGVGYFEPKIVTRKNLYQFTDDPLFDTSINLQTTLGERDKIQKETSAKAVKEELTTADLLAQTNRIDKEADEFARKHLGISWEALGKSEPKEETILEYLKGKTLTTRAKQFFDSMIK